MNRGSGIRIGGGRTLLMGVLNVTPDSFSDGGRFFEGHTAIEHGIELVRRGADILDVGGESTRPGHARVAAAEQIERVVPVIRALAARVETPISIDTTLLEVAQAALDAGASWINDTTALGDDPALADLAAERGAMLVLMHRFEPPRTADSHPAPGRALVREIVARLRPRLESALQRGVPRESLVIDPGVGFGTLIEDALALHAFVDDLRELGLPLMFGTSRKSFLGRLTNRSVGEREFATAASVARLVHKRVEIVRVHDVGAMRDVVTVTEAIRSMEAVA